MFGCRSRAPAYGTIGNPDRDSPCRTSPPSIIRWLSLYWDTPPDGLRKSKELKDALLLDWLERFARRAGAG